MLRASPPPLTPRRWPSSSRQTGWTIWSERFSRHFAEAPLPDYLEYAVHTAWQIHESGAEGDILVFLTGQRRWLKLCEDSGPSPPWTI